VLRDALTSPQTDAAFAAEIRARLDGLRRDGRAPATSPAAQTTRGFAGYERLADAALQQQGVRQGHSPVLSGSRGRSNDG
jgi:hypothetical protein